MVLQHDRFSMDLVHSRPRCLRVWESLRRRCQNLAWQRMLFDPTKTFCFFCIYFIANVLFCFGIRTEQIQLTEPLKNFQVSKVIVVAAEKIPLNQGKRGGVSKKICGTVRLPVWRHVSRQWLSKWQAKCSSKRRIQTSISSRKYCSDFLDFEILRFLLS